MNSDRGTTPTLLPHQRALLDQFTSQPGIYTIVARWAPGLGAYLTGSHVVQAFVRSHPQTRVLVLTPKILQEQARERLLSLGIDAIAVDRYFYRAMEDSSNLGAALWPEGKVFVLGVEFARQSDITEGLAAVPWGLLVVFDGQRQDDARRVVQRLLDTSPSMRLLAFASDASKSDEAIGHAPRIEVSANLRDVVDFTGSTQWLRPTLEAITVEPEPAELHFEARVRALVAALRVAGPAWQLAATKLVSQLQSSQAAVEAGLRRVRNRLIHGVPPVSANESSSDAFELTESSDALGEHSQTLVAMVNECLEELDSLPIDSKSSALLRLVQRLRAENTNGPLISVFSEYRATVLYLKVALEETGGPVHVLHGGMDWSERAQVGKAIREEGGLFASTQVLASEAIDLPQCGTLIFYDLPSQEDVLDRVFMRFQRIGRRTPLNIYLFAPLAVDGLADSDGVGIRHLETLISDGR
jgi:hypothetical protein